MGFYTRKNAEQSALTDEAYAVVLRHNGVVLGKGLLAEETRQDARSVLAALELLAKEGKIRIDPIPQE
jgi:hypothetical protein